MREHCFFPGKNDDGEVLLLFFERQFDDASEGLSELLMVEFKFNLSSNTAVAS